MNALDRIIVKVTSGQWILTMACAFTFCWCSVNGILEKDAIGAIVGMVFVSYFQRNRNGQTTNYEKPIV